MTGSGLDAPESTRGEPPREAQEKEWKTAPASPEALTEWNNRAGGTRVRVWGHFRRTYAVAPREAADRLGVSHIGSAIVRPSWIFFLLAPPFSLAQNGATS